jgi:MFS transporter, MHS family, shikimate and dehydroshikimate transport protein
VRRSGRARAARRAPAHVRLFLYGTAAALVFGDLFFPEAKPLVGTLLAFSTYAVGFAARPIGGIVFGHYGDRIGRKSMLVLSLLIMGVATFLIGCMPTYAAIGVGAPLLLVLLRFAQGIGVGGEWGGAVLMSVEHAPKGRRGFFGAWPQMGVPAGLLLSTAVFALVQAVTSDAAFLSWGWRVPFLASAILVIVGPFIRLKLMESPAFERVKERRPRRRGRSSTSCASTRARFSSRWACASRRTGAFTSSPSSCSHTVRTSWD